MDTSLYIDLPQTELLPEAQIEGRILWALEKPPETLKLTLGWWTEGRGTQDGKVEAELEWTTDQLAGKEPFQFKLPATPYSFTGHLINLQWGLELSTKKGKHTYVQNITMGPNLKTIDLPLIDEGKRKSISLKRTR